MSFWLTTDNTQYIIIHSFDEVDGIAQHVPTFLRSMYRHTYIHNLFLTWVETLIAEAKLPKHLLSKVKQLIKAQFNFV